MYLGFLWYHEAGHPPVSRAPRHLNTRPAGRIAGQGNRSLCRGTMGSLSNCCQHHYMIAVRLKDQADLVGFSCGAGLLSNVDSCMEC